MAQTEGACLKRAIQQYLDHSHASKVRAAICAKVEELTGIERKHETNDDGKKTKFTETENVYITRVENTLAQEDRSLNSEEFEPAIQEAAAAVPVDLTKTVRSGGSVNNVAKKWLDMATALIEAGKWDAFVEKYNVTLTDDDEQNLRLVGDKCRTVTAEIQKKALADAMASV